MLNPKAKVLNRHKEAKSNDSKAKDEGRKHANKRRKVGPSEIQVGDTVILKPRKKNNFTTKFEPTPYTVLDRR